MSVRVQVVEDELIVALDIKTSLQLLGFEVTGVSSTGENAINLARRDKPDLVLMDINLAGDMDGTKASAVIGSELDIPVVFLTAYAEGDVFSRAIETAPYGYLVKPFEVREMKATLLSAKNRHEADRRVREAENRLRLAMDAAELGILDWREEVDKLEIDGCFSYLSGEQEPEPDSGMNALSRIFHSDDRALLESAIHGDELIKLELRLQGDSLIPVWVDFFAKKYRFGGSGLSQILGVIRDITSRKIMEDELRRASVVFGSSADAIVVSDVDRKVLCVNSSFLAMTGFSVEESLGVDADQLFHAKPYGDEFYQHLITGGSGRWRGEAVCRNVAGGQLSVLESISVVRGANGIVNQLVFSFSDITAIRDAETRLNHLAYYDALTGLGNRNLLAERLSQEIDRASRSGKMLALIFIDLDGFKNINDSLGHVVGDEFLAYVALRLRRSVRSSDVLIRLGGDEFVVIAPDISKRDDAAAVAEKMIESLSTPIDLKNEILTATGSIGVALYPEDATAPDVLIKYADSAMYDAKEHGRNRFSFYSSDMSEKVGRRLKLEQGLRIAVKEQQLQLHYQPVCRLETGRVVGYEALVRWLHPVEGLISPALFIPVAEESGMIDMIGEFVLAEACRQGVKWINEGREFNYLSVNVSPRQFKATNFLKVVERSLTETGLPPSKLELEITESSLQDHALSLRMMRELKALGVAIAIDDFGTGFSSLSLLKHLPIDRLKIDQSFVRELPDAENDLAIVKAILSLGLTMKIGITAEGIETLEQKQLLADLGCPFGQGYFFGKPTVPESL